MKMCSITPTEEMIEGIIGGQAPRLPQIMQQVSNNYTAAVSPQMWADKWIVQHDSTHWRTLWEITTTKCPGIEP